MTTYVLVGGAWLGAWAWKDVARRLRALGHDVYPLSLTGLGERAHLASPAVDLDTHIADIVQLLESEDLRDVVLVAHSYGTMPVTGAADRAPGRIARLVYLDTGPVSDGVALADLDPPEVQRLVDQQIQQEGDGWRWPLPSWEVLEHTLAASLAGLSDEQRAYLRVHATPHPYGAFRQPLRLTRPDAAPLPKLAILCSFTEEQIREMIASGHPFGQAMAGPEWQFVELLTGHWPMFSEPERLASILHEAGTAR